jgi:hypothetical protein
MNRIWNVVVDVINTEYQNQRASESQIIYNIERCNLEHNIFNLHYTEVIICIILFILKKADGLNHYPNYI